MPMLLNFQLPMPSADAPARRETQRDLPSAHVGGSAARPERARWDLTSIWKVALGPDHARVYFSSLQAWWPEAQAGQAYTCSASSSDPAIFGAPACRDCAV
jgi:hypothetical protein